MPDKPFMRYIIRGPDSSWWEKRGAAFLKKRDWHFTSPRYFSYKSSYGFNPDVCRSPEEQVSLSYSIQRAHAVVEYHGEPPQDSMFFRKAGFTVIDDLLPFMSLYSGVHCHWLWKENWAIKFRSGFTLGDIGDQWAGPQANAGKLFERAVATVSKFSSMQRDPVDLALQWFFSVLEAGRPTGKRIVEAGILWTALEVQAKCLGIAGHKHKGVHGVKFGMVEDLLTAQKFPSIPALKNLYSLRNGAFHEGRLSNLSPADAVKALEAGRALVRAKILNLLGMQHSDFSPAFVKLYAS